MLFFLQLIVIGQTNSFYGEILSATDKTPIIGATVSLNNLKQKQQTDANGHFHFYNINADILEVEVSSYGFKDYADKIAVSKNKLVILYLEPKSHSLTEVVILNHTDTESTLSTDFISKKFIFDNNSSNLVKTLSKVLGLSSMDIGSGISKPIIRGLGFNRVAVVDKGITQQGQQWGADHGLEIDQFDVDEAIVHKGSSSLQFGSDAIGGVIEILPAKAPTENMYIADLTLMGRSNNDLLGFSLMNALKKDKWFLRLRYTNQRYSDFRVPADSLTYLNTRLPIYNQRLKNTAGKEEDFSALIQYNSDRFKNNLVVTNVYQKNGFFPGAHGVVGTNQLEHDGSYRNIDMPYSTVNHFKVINNTRVQLKPSLEWITDLAYQYNHRQEISSFHSHYPNAKPPVNNPELELDFKLHTYTLNSKVQLDYGDNFIYTIGTQTSLQNNRVGGYSFFLPRYNQITIGGYGMLDYHYNDKLSIMGGLRYDYGNIVIDGFYDDLLADYLERRGYSPEIIKENAQRALDADRHFSNFSASLGLMYKYNSNHLLKANIGKSFRFPTANELSSNGVHHGSFRHEEGNPDLNPEVGYQLDVAYTFNKDVFEMTVSPFVSYFNNYIYIQPMGVFSPLPDAGQLYKFQQANAVFGGGEAEVHLAFGHRFDWYTSAQYVYNRNEKDHYPLPMTPPFSLRNEITYTNKYKILQSYKIGLEHRYMGDQKRISRNELITKNSNIFNFTSNLSFKIDKFSFTLGFQVHNIFNTQYYNHLNYYRSLEIPELGRNIQLLFKIPIYNQF